MHTEFFAGNLEGRDHLVFLDGGGGDNQNIY
jgi:hypothetical protein